MLITDQLFDMYEYMGFDIREKREQVFRKIKILKRNRRMKDHNNRYMAIKENLKKKLHDFFNKMVTKIQSKEE